MKFEIINPSDKAFIEGDDLMEVCVANALLGGGFYGLEQVGGDFRMPLLVFGGVNDWFCKTFKGPFDVCMSRVPLENLAKVLESVHLEGERTSLNDIVAKAKTLAIRCREKAKKEKLKQVVDDIIHAEPTMKET